MHKCKLASRVVCPACATTTPYADMPTDHIIALLVAERDKLNRAIETLQGPINRRGRPLKSPLLTVLAPLTTPGKEEKVRRRAQDTLLTHEAILGGEEEEELRASPSAADFEAPPKTGRSVYAFCYRKPKDPSSLRTCVNIPTIINGSTTLAGALFTPATATASFSDFGPDAFVNFRLFGAPPEGEELAFFQMRIFDLL